MATCAFQLPISLTAGAGPHVTVAYDAGPDEDLTFATSTLYPLDGAGTSYVLQALETLLNTDTNATTWVVQDASSGLTHRTAITSSGGTDNPVSITFNTTELTARDLGLSATAGAGVTVNLTGGAVTGVYRRRYLWATNAPETLHLIPLREDLNITAHSRFANTGLTVPVGFRQDVQLGIQFIDAALVYSDLAAVPAYAAFVDGLTVGDPNCAFDTWWDTYLGLVSDAGAHPTARFHADDTDETTYTDLQFQHESHSRFQALITDTGSNPLYYHFGTRDNPVLLTPV